MKALQLVAPRRLELGEMPDPPDPKPGEVLVKIKAVGVCGSDLHYYVEGGCAGTDALYPSVLGHEPAGEIVAYGPGADGLQPGAHVAVEPALVCGRCDACRSGQRNLCENCVFLGGVQGPGLLREYAVVPASNVVPIPESMDFATAALVEPLAVLLHALELARLQIGETVVVLGAGPIGALAVAASKLAGASRVIVADRVGHRLDAARKLGADVAVDISKDSVQDAVFDLTHGQGAHVGFDAAGKPDSIDNTLQSLRFGGRLVIIGIPSQAPLGIDLWRAMKQEISIHVQKRSNSNDHEALDMLARGLIDVSTLITHRFPLEKGAEAFETAAEYTDGVVKAVVEI